MSLHFIFRFTFIFSLFIISFNQLIKRLHFIFDFTFKFSLDTISLTHFINSENISLTLKSFSSTKSLYNSISWRMETVYVNCNPRLCKGTMTKKDNDDTTVTTKKIQKRILSITNAICRHSLTTRIRWSSCSWRCKM